MNKIILIGRLVRDPELRYTTSGLAVANFTLAVDRNYKNATGEKETDFVRVVVWRKLAEAVTQYLTKGKLAAVEGCLQIRNYEGNDGVKRQTAEVLAENVKFLEGKGKATEHEISVSEVAEYHEELPWE